MLRLYRNSVLVLITAALAIFAGSCSRDKDDPFSDNLYLLSAEKVFNIPQAGIINLLTILASAEPGVSGLTQYVEHDVDVWRITYSTTLYGESITASGLVCVPSSPGDYPVLSFQNGTNTEHANAPSVNPGNFSYQLVENVASMGFVVIIPDYPGFGSSDNKAHPYLLKEPTVRAVTDMLEAVREFDTDVALHADLTDDLYLFGYSQGGWATIALHRAVEQGGAAGYTLKGSAAGAGPTDLPAMLEGFMAATTYPMPSYMAYIAHAYKTYNRFTQNYIDIFNEPYASRIPGLFNGTLSTGSINDELTTDVEALLKPAFRSGFSSDPVFAGVKQALTDNGIAPWKTNIPLLLIHGDGDTQVPAAGTISFHDDMIAAGSSSSVVLLEIIPGADHGDGLIPAAVRSLLFLIALTGNR